MNATSSYSLRAAQRVWTDEAAEKALLHGAMAEAILASGHFGSPLKPAEIRQLREDDDRLRQESALLDPLPDGAREALFRQTGIVLEEQETGRHGQ